MNIFKYIEFTSNNQQRRYTMLTLTESFEKLNGFPLAKYLVIKSELDLTKLEFPYWLKADIEGHKTEQKAIVKVKNLEQAKSELKELRKSFPTQKIIAQEDKEGMSIILGLKEDRVFGKLLLIGFGGTFTEIVKDISFRALPISKKDIEEMIKQLKLYNVLVSRKKYTLDKLISLAEKFSKQDFKEADLNPVILTEKDAFVVDARIEL